MSFNNFLIAISLVQVVCGLVASYSAFESKNPLVVAASGISVGLGITMLGAGVMMNIQVVS